MKVTVSSKDGDVWRSLGLGGVSKYIMTAASELIKTSKTPVPQEAAETGPRMPLQMCWLEARGVDVVGDTVRTLGSTEYSTQLLRMSWLRSIRLTVRLSLRQGLESRCWRGSRWWCWEPSGQLGGGDARDGGS